MKRFLFYALILAVITACSGQKGKPAGEHHSNDFFNDSSITKEEVLIKGTDGQEHSVEQLKGNVVIMDVLYSTPSKDDKHIAQLKSVYARYNSSGLEIYQVCMDTIPSRWTAYAKTLPWVTVYDDNTLKSDLLRKYHVVNIPSMQVFDKDGKRISAVAPGSDLENIIKPLMK